MNGENGEAKSVAERLRVANQRSVELEPGLTVKVQAVSAASLMADGSMPPTTNLGEVAVNRASPEFGRMLLGIVKLGMVEPRVWTGRGDCPYDKGFVTLEDLARHHMKLMNEIWDLSGWSVVESQAATFRGEAGNGGDAVAPREADGSLAAGGVAAAGG